VPQLLAGLLFFFHNLIVYKLNNKLQIIKDLKLIACIGDVSSTNRKVSAIPPKKTPNLKDVYGGIAVYFWVD
jgi:hypothetical protein